MRVGIVGFGNMGQALSVCLSRKLGKENILVTDKDETKRGLALEQGFGFASDVRFLNDTDIIILAVKPKDAFGVLKSLKDYKGIIVSVMAGVSIKDIENIVGQDKKIVRLMPNIAVAVSSGAMAITDNGKLTEEERQKIEEVFLACGTLYKIDESLFDAFTALAGSSPAYVLGFIDALALAGVYLGFNYEQALRIATDVVLGSAKLLRNSAQNPSALITKVTSPGGTTIEGLKLLEREGFKGIIMECLEKTAGKAKELRNSSSSGKTNS